MSAYSDWKCGALTDEEYRFCMRRECGDFVPDIDLECDDSEGGEEE